MSTRTRKRGKPGTRDGLVRKFAARHRISVVQARVVLDSVLSAILEDVRETGRLVLPEFGTFRRGVRKAKTVRAPNGELCDVPEQEEVRFRSWRGGR